MIRQNTSRLETGTTLINISNKRLLANMLAGPSLAIVAGTALHYWSNKAHGYQSNSGNPLVDTALNLTLAFVSNIPHIAHEAMLGFAFSIGCLYEYKMRRERKLDNLHRQEQGYGNPYSVINNKERKTLS